MPTKKPLTKEQKTQLRANLRELKAAQKDIAKRYRALDKESNAVWKEFDKIEAALGIAPGFPY